MPKLRQKRSELRERTLIAEINKYKSLKGLSPEVLAVKSRINISTWYIRMRNPGSFRLEELWRLSEALGVNLLDYANGAD